ncbi:homeobox protein dve-1 isoform X2 [Parasteatoda tepidariorum]|nr:homeobox protein dve-1 isoform X2 [Parasteatoda tepidariorum]
MDFQSAMETFAEAWVAANTQTPLTEAAETQGLLLSGGVSSGGGGCPHDLNSDRREKPESHPALPSEPGIRSPGSSSTSLSLVEFRPLMKIPPVSSSSTPAGRSIPVHCIVEQVSPQGQSVDLSQSSVDLDNYAIIPSNALFSELVRTALNKLGYSSSEALAAKGAIQLKNWKPLTFDQITESPEATVGDILGELSTVATLRIRLYSRPKLHSANDVKEKLLQVLLAQSQNILVSSGCPIDQSILAALTKGRLECDIPDETRKKFDQWYLQQVFQHCRQVALLQQQQQQQQQQHIHHHHSHHPAIVQPGEPMPVPGSPPPHTPQDLVSRVTIAGAQSQGRTRIRTSFDPELELPKLHRWFAENQHPSRLQIQQYVRELNSLESRRGRKPLDVNNVVYWFKNARAAHKRAEQKCCSESNGVRSPCADGINENRTMVSEQATCRPSNENEGERFSGESHSESQANSSDDSDNVHTLDLSVRRCHNYNIESEHNEPQVELRIKEEPRDSSSEHSIESSDSGDDEVDVMEDMNMTIDDPREGYHDAMQQNGGISGNDNLISPDGDIDRQGSGAFPSRVLGRLEERRKRNRTFIDPVSEVPRLEQWFSANTHPSHSQIVRFTQELNSMQYRQKFPKLEPKNIQFWFKNRRAKCKRLNLAANLQNVSCTDKIVLPAN